jgi:hypothetical protein
MGRLRSALQYSPGRYPASLSTATNVHVPAFPLHAACTRREIDWRYVDGLTVMPSDEEIRALPAES